MPSPVLPSVLDQMLQRYDVGKRKFLVKGFSAGFEIGCLSLPVQNDKRVKNMRSAFEYPQVIDTKLAKEVALGRVLGPFDNQPTTPAYRISPLGVVPKKVPGEYRMIHNLSHPEGSSVNDYIPQELATVQYASIQNAISFIKDAETIVFMAKVDIESAFRIIPIAPKDTPLLGFKFRFNKI